MIQRQRMNLHVGGKELTVWEANWDMSASPDRMVKEAQEAIKVNEDRSKFDILSFSEIVYPWLASFTTGNTLSLQEAFELPDADLDGWYLAVRCTNPGLFSDELPTNTIVSFRDQSSFAVKSAFLPSSLRRLIQLDNLAHIHLLDNPTDLSTFSRMKVYAKMACCVIGDIPTFEQVGDWPSSELEKWYEAVLRTNPHLFLSAEDLAEIDRIKEKDEEAKKNSAPRTSSSSSRASSKRKVVTSQPQ